MRIKQNFYSQVKVLNNRIMETQYRVLNSRLCYSFASRLGYKTYSALR